MLRYTIGSSTWVLLIVSGRNKQLRSMFRLVRHRPGSLRDAKVRDPASPPATEKNDHCCNSIIFLCHSAKKLFSFY
jgi:hypothetical protein